MRLDDTRTSVVPDPLCTVHKVIHAAGGKEHRARIDQLTLVLA